MYDPICFLAVVPVSLTKAQTEFAQESFAVAFLAHFIFSFIVCSTFFPVIADIILLQRFVKMSEENVSDEKVWCMLISFSFVKIYKNIIIRCCVIVITGY